MLCFLLIFWQDTSSGIYRVWCSVAQSTADSCPTCHQRSASCPQWGKNWSWRGPESPRATHQPSPIRPRTRWVCPFSAGASRWGIRSETHPARIAFHRIWWDNFRVDTSASSGWSGPPVACPRSRPQRISFKALAWSPWRRACLRFVAKPYSCQKCRRSNRHPHAWPRTTSADWICNRPDWDGVAPWLRGTSCARRRALNWSQWFHSRLLL